MFIREATKNDFQQLMRFYDIMCHYLGEKDFLPEGNKGGFPSEEMVRSAIDEGLQFVGVEDDKIAAAYIMSHGQDPAYNTADWQTELPASDVVTLHALRVLPEYGGRGYAKQLVGHAIQTARGRGFKAIRLDCIEGNEVPQRMYCSLGFRRVGSAKITYADIGVPRVFQLFEYLI